MKQRKKFYKIVIILITQLSSKSPSSLTKLITLERDPLAIVKAKEITGTGSFFWTSKPLRWMLNYSSFCSQPNTSPPPPPPRVSKLCKTISLSVKMHLPDYSLELQFFQAQEAQDTSLNSAPFWRLNAQLVFSNFGLLGHLKISLPPQVPVRASI